MYSAQQPTMTHLSAMKKWQISQALRGEDSAPSTNGQRTSFIRSWTNFSRNYLSNMWSGNNQLSVTIVNDEILNSSLLENSSIKNKDLTYISQEKKLLHDLSKQNYPKDCVLPMFSVLEQMPMNQYSPNLTNKIRNDVNLLKNLGNIYKDNSKMESHSVLRVNKTEKSMESTMNYPSNPSNVNSQQGDIHEDTDVESFFVVSHSDVPAVSINFRENPMSRFSNACRNVWNSLTSRLYCKPESSRMFVKRPLYLVKHRRKVNAITVGRGRGRTKCQLRRSGVSQTIWNRKECIKSDDETWQNNLVDITVNDCLLDNKLDSLGSNVDTVDFTRATRQITSPAIPSSSRATSTKGKLKARKKKKIKAKNITKVHYIANSRMNDYCEDSNGEMPNVREDSCRLRTLSENSSDGWIVFEDDHDDDEWPEIREKQEATEYPTEACCVINSSIRMSDRTFKNSKIYEIEQALCRLRLSSENSTDSENSSHSSIDSKQETTECPRMHYDHSMKISDENCKDYSSKMQKTAYQHRRLLLNSSNDSEDSKSDISDTSNSSSEENDVDDCDEMSFHDGDSQLEDDSVVFAEEDSEELTAQTKKVKFNPQPVTHVMIAWDYAYRAARRGPWEQFARDNERFRGRINSIAFVLDPILKNPHRSQVWKERFAFPD